MALDYVKTKDRQYLRVDRIGSGPKIAVLIHGIGGSSHLWIPFALSCSKEYTYIIPNLRGFGKSKDVDFLSTTDVLFDFARDIDSVIEHYRGDDRVVVCALSMGAYSMMRYFEMYGTEAVERYMNIDQSAKAINSADWQWGIGGDKHDALFEEFKRNLSEFDAEIEKPFPALDRDLRDCYLSSLSEFFGIAFHRPIEKLVAQHMLQIPFVECVARKAVSADNWESYLFCLDSYQSRDYDFRETMLSLDIPVTLFIGAESEMYPAEGQRDMLRNPRFGSVEFAEGHALMYTAPVQFQREMNRFLMEKQYA